MKNVLTKKFRFLFSVSKIAVTKKPSQVFVQRVSASCYCGPHGTVVQSGICRFHRGEHQIHTVCLFLVFKSDSRVIPSILHYQQRRNRVRELLVPLESVARREFIHSAGESSTLSLCRQCLSTKCSQDIFRGDVCKSKNNFRLKCKTLTMILLFFSIFPLAFLMYRMWCKL